MSVVRERRDGDMGAVTFGEIIEMTAAVRRHLSPELRRRVPAGRRRVQLQGWSFQRHGRLPRATHAT